MTFRIANDIVSQIVVKWKIEEAYINLNLNIDHLGNTKVDDFKGFFGHLQSVGKLANLMFLEKNYEFHDLTEFAGTSPLPLLVFEKDESGEIQPLLMTVSKRKITTYRKINDFWQEKETDFKETEKRLLSVGQVYELNDLVSIERSAKYVLVPLHIKPMVSDDTSGEKMTPFKRLMRLIETEKKEIFYIYVYAIMAGVLGLTLPLGIQSIIGLIAGGLILNSVVMLIAFVIFGTFIGGFLQIMQMSVVESLQRRLFARAAFEFTYRIPRVRMEALFKHYAPELINRFFDVLTLQKGFAKILTELITAVLQGTFGLILLSFYHPIFVFLGIFLVITLSVFLYATGPKGLKTSLYESKYKYRIAHWLEEIARTLTTFKLAGNTLLPMSKMNEELMGYLYKRKSHFHILVLQYAGMIGFKTIITGTVLIVGSVLVVDRQITLGQFVASEIVIITVMNAVEKLILNLDTVYDVLTAVEKIGNFTDLPLEDINNPLHFPNKPFHIELHNVSYRYPGATKSALNGVSFDMKPGQNLGIVGSSGSGKTTLMYVVTGLLQEYEGGITYNGYSLRDLNIKNLRDLIGDNLSHEDLFDGTILENITVGRQNYSYEDLLEVVRIAELEEFIFNAVEGFSTQLTAGGNNLASSVRKKIILARSLLNRPKLIVFDDFFYNLEGNFKERMLNKIMDKSKYDWSILAISHDPVLLSKMDKICLMREGKIIKEGTFYNLSDDKDFAELIPFRHH
jgi:ABC-type bacteriocin/lantibiotic exporter with double-glycine peptidase domain